MYIYLLRFYTPNIKPTSQTNMIKLNSNRSFWLCLLFNIITLGIYNYALIYKFSKK